jgi:ParB-like chromosome segregation protein Spo0J
LSKTYERSSPGQYRKDDPSMNAFVRPAKHVFVSIDEIDLSHTIRPYNASVVAELAQSIRAIGLQTPLTCIVRDGHHILVSGRNRLEALRVIACEQAPVRVVDFDDVDAELWRLSENLHRAELTKLEYDKQVVRYAELLKAKLVGETTAPPLQAPKVEPLRQTGAQYGELAAAKVSSRFVARELNIPEQTVRRAYQTSSLSPEAQEAAVETGLDDNRSALLEAAKAHSPRAQAEVIRGIAKKRTLAVESSANEIAAAPQQTAKPLRDLLGISGGELARWIKVTTPNDRSHVVRVLETAASILRDELEGRNVA